MLNRTKKAFTLLELIVVLLVLGILAAIAVPTFATVKENAAERTFQTTIEAVARNANAIATSEGALATTQAHLDQAITEVSNVVQYDVANPLEVSGTVGDYTVCAAFATQVGGPVTVSTWAYAPSDNVCGLGGGGK